MIVLPLALALTAAGCSPGGESGGSGGGGQAADEPSEQAAPLEVEDADPDACTGDSVFIEAVEIPGLTTGPVTIPEVGNEAGEVLREEQQIPGVEIPDRRVPAQCATVEEAPAGRLGGVPIPPSALPPVTVPETTVPGSEYGGAELEEVVAEEATQEGTEVEGASAEEVCRISEEEVGENGLIASVLRPSVRRDSLLRDSVQRPSITRPGATLEDGTSIRSVYVPHVFVASAYLESVCVESRWLGPRSVGDVEVLENEESIAFDPDADVLFEVDSAEVRSEADEALGGVAAQIEEELPAGVPVEVDGHTDSDGEQDDNQDLSELRARSVVDRLVAEEGLDADRFTVTGYGETKPAASDDTDQGKQKNRRVMVPARV